LTVRNVQERIKRYAEAAGVTKRVTPHSLRHSIAVHYLQGGASLNVLQQLLGHAHLGTTGRYLQLTDQMAKRIAVGTETGVERLVAMRQEGLSVEEKREEYHVNGDLERWDLYVTVVGEWLGR
jgi:histidyl-tRNA synthetase